MKKWLTIAEAAALAGRHKRQIYRWIDDCKLSPNDVGRDFGSGALVVRADAIRALQVKRGRPKGTASRNGRRTEGTA